MTIITASDIALRMASIDWNCIEDRSEFSRRVRNEGRDFAGLDCEWRLDVIMAEFDCDAATAEAAHAAYPAEIYALCLAAEDEDEDEDAADDATAAVLVTIAATHTSEHLPANRLAVDPAVFARLCRESGIAGIDGCDELHITAGTDDAAELDALDDLLRDRAQTAGDFIGAECFVLLPGQGIDDCDVWARCSVEAVEEERA